MVPRFRVLPILLSLSSAMFTAMLLTFTPPIVPLTRNVSLARAICLPLLIAILPKLPQTATQMEAMKLQLFQPAISPAHLRKTAYLQPSHLSILPTRTKYSLMQSTTNLVLMAWHTLPIRTIFNATLHRSRSVQF